MNDEKAQIILSRSDDEDFDVENNHSPRERTTTMKIPWSLPLLFRGLDHKSEVDKREDYLLEAYAAGRDLTIALREAAKKEQTE